MEAAPARACENEFPRLHEARDEPAPMRLDYDKPSGKTAIRIFCYPQRVRILLTSPCQQPLSVSLASSPKPRTDGRLAQVDTDQSRGARMTDQRLDQFASVIAAELRETELRIDMSLAQAGVLLTSMTAGRNEAGLPASFGQTALTKLGAAIATGVEYRSSLISLHRSLEAAGNKIGADWSLGDLPVPKPDDAPD